MFADQPYLSEVMWKLISHWLIQDKLEVIKPLSYLLWSFYLPDLFYFPLQSGLQSQAEAITPEQNIWADETVPLSLLVLFFLLKVNRRSQKKEHPFHGDGTEPLYFTNDVLLTHDFSWV